MGRSQRGFSTKIDLICDRPETPLSVTVGIGQEYKTRQFEPLVEEATVWPEQPEELTGDKGYSADWVREWLWERGIEPVIIYKSNQQRSRKRLDRTSYRRRNIIERCVNSLNLIVANRVSDRVTSTSSGVPRPSTRIVNLLENRPGERPRSWSWGSSGWSSRLFSGSEASGTDRGAVEAPEIPADFPLLVQPQMQCVEDTIQDAASPSAGSSRRRFPRDQRVRASLATGLRSRESTITPRASDDGHAADAPSWRSTSEVGARRFLTHRRATPAASWTDLRP
jgi:hypothetical protein